MHHHSPAEPLTLATVLLVKSDAVAAEDLVQSLVDERYQIIVVSSVAEAVLVLATQAVDVVLADQELPGVSDGELFSTLRLSQPSIIRILLADDAESNAARRDVNAGRAHHWLRKACDSGELPLLLFNALVQRSFLPPESECEPPVASELTTTRIR